jgi:hypothetical protein
VSVAPAARLTSLNLTVSEPYPWLTGSCATQSAPVALERMPCASPSAGAVTAGTEVRRVITSGPVPFAGSASSAVYSVGP